MSRQATPSYSGRRSAFHARYATIDRWENGNQRISNADQVTPGALEDECSSHKEVEERNGTTALHLWHLSINNISTNLFERDALSDLSKQRRGPFFDL